MSCIRTAFALLCATMLLAATSAGAQVATDRPAALLDFPYIVADSAAGLDTVVQLTNTSTLYVARLRCVFENANGHCSNAPGTICAVDGQCPATGTCVAGWSVTDFALQLTAGQPIGFRASQGLAPLPCDGGVGCPGVASGAIPPLPEDPFVGRLQCVVVDGSDQPSGDDLVRGRATVERAGSSPARLDAASYNAIGFRGTGSNDGDFSLQLGGPTAEYLSCPNITVVPHFFENAVDPVSGDAHVFTRLAIAPCGQDPFVTMAPGTTTLDYLVFNEFEQRLLVRHTFTGLQTTRLSQIEALAWDVGLQGTLTGQTRISSVSNNPVVVTAIEEHVDDADPTHLTTAALDVAVQGLPAEVSILGGGGAGTCGNGTVEPGEQCDDGNLSAEDGCDGTCLIEDCYQAQAVTPSSCNPGSGSLQVTDKSPDDRDGLKWRFDGPTASAAFEGFDNPVAATDYTLCVFEGSTLKLHASVTHVGTCGAKPCWKKTGTGFGYRNAATNGSGLKLVKLKSGEGLLSVGSILVKGKGANLPLPGPATTSQYFQNPVRAVLVKQAGAECWETELGTPTKNTATTYSASTP